MVDLSELRRIRKRDLLKRLELKEYLEGLTDPKEIENISWRIFELVRNIDYLSNEIYKRKCNYE